MAILIVRNAVLARGLVEGLVDRSFWTDGLAGLLLDLSKALGLRARLGVLVEDSSLEVHDGGGSMAHGSALVDSMGASALSSIEAGLDLGIAMLAEHRWLGALGYKWRLGGSFLPGGRHFQFLLDGMVAVEGQSGSGEQCFPVDKAVSSCLLAGKLFEGCLPNDKDSAAPSLDGFRMAFALGARGAGFNGDSAARYRSQLDLCKALINQGFAHAFAADPQWLPCKALASEFSGVAKKGSPATAADWASCMGLSQLASEMERRALERALPGSAARSGSRSL